MKKNNYPYSVYKRHDGWRVFVARVLFVDPWIPGRMKDHIRIVAALSKEQWVVKRINYPDEHEAQLALDNMADMSGWRWCGKNKTIPRW